MNREIKFALIALPIVFFSNLILGVFLGMGDKYIVSGHASPYLAGFFSIGQVPLFDTFHHFMGGFFVTLFMFGYLREISTARNIRKIKKWLVLIGATLFVGIVWEFAEWIATYYNNPYIGIGDLDDTIFDLFADIAGAATLLILHPFRDRDSEQI